MKTRTFRKLTSLVLSIMLILSMCMAGISVSAAEGTKTIYLAVSESWKKNNPRMVAYLWMDDATSTFTTMTKVEEGLYSAEIAYDYTNVVFSAMNPDSTVNDSINTWYYTDELKITESNNFFRVYQWYTANAPSDTDTPTTDLSKFKYNVLDDGTAEISSYTGDDATVVIPSTIDGYKVTKIGAYAFNSYYGEGRKTIIVPEGVTSIGRCAFSNSPYIQEVQLPESLERIEREAFYYCQRLSKINFPDKLAYIGTLAFAYAENIKDVALNGGNITEIDDSAFFECDGLESATIKGNNALIDNYAFKNCTYLNSLTLNGIKTIGQDSFAGCNLTELILPNGVESLTYSSFALNPSLKSVVIPTSVSKIDTSSFYGCDNNLTFYGYTGSYAETFVNNYPMLEITFVALDKFKYNVLDDGTPEISSYTGDDAIVVIPSTIDGYKVTKIGAYAFNSYYGEGRKTIIVPEGVTSIGRDAFGNSMPTQKIQLPESLEVIEKNTFYNCQNLTTINFPEKLRFIGDLAFAYCESLKEVTLDSGNIEEIDNSAFFNCYGLESVTIKGENILIDNYSFYGCKELESLTLEGIKTIGQDAFTYCNLTEVVLPDGLESLTFSSFALNPALKSVVMPASVTKMEGSTFYGCDENLVIYGYSGSYAETYFNNSPIPGITFVALDGASITGDINLKLTNNSGIYTGTTTLEAGTYSFKIDIAGTQYGAGHKITDKADSFVYNSSWKSSTTFVATGGEYTFTFNSAKNTLSITHKKTSIDTVELIGDISKSLTKSANNKNIFSGDIELTAGTYSFKLAVDGTEFGGKYTFTNSISNVTYNPSWKSATTFKSTGGKYTVTFNTKTNTLTIAPKKTILSVAIVGNLEFELAPTTSNQNVFTATVEIPDGAYNFKVSVDGTEYGSGAKYTDKFTNVYSPSWKSFTTFNATGGTYKFTFDATTNKLTVVHM